MTEKKTKVKKIIGVVEKVSGQNTIKVTLESKSAHKIYERIIRSHMSFLAHVENDSKVKVGDKVEITAVKPISKNKSWMVTKVLNSK